HRRRDPVDPRRVHRGALVECAVDFHGLFPAGVPSRAGRAPSIVEGGGRLRRGAAVRAARPSVEGQTRPRAGGTIRSTMSKPDRIAAPARPTALRRSVRACRARCLQRIACVALLFGVIGASTAVAQQDDADDPARLFESRPEQFVVANAQLVLMHELAHLVIDEKRVPILGPEESAADYIAAMMLIRPRTLPPEGPDALLQVAVNTAEGFALAWRRRERVGAELPYWDNHSLTVQRFSTLACLLYGSNPKRFSILVERLDMPESRARACIREYERAAYAIDWLFDTYARKETDP